MGQETGGITDFRLLISQLLSAVGLGQGFNPRRCLRPVMAARHSYEGSRSALVKSCPGLQVLYPRLLEMRDLVSPRIISFPTPQFFLFCFSSKE